MTAEFPTLEELRPLIHHQMVVLTGFGMSPARALAVAAETTVTVYNDALVLEAIEHARRAIDAQGTCAELAPK
ncbi:hypothetical protein GJ654_12400 [Rhodoblastus acidophilus]|uniref:Uncharacterized protein n=1 Tax=Rhodoblastus acidophilus TaxID=1074 RepID=A0A6N8DMZ6_RHOAC|nr:hypothetical protein [Rhodoblastus acidophilus]MCW2275321.1 hypothetical protein [Rhodoblastus acidophilus]MTV31787.1 hypothetical protein [Rhodoblastus acidophilus]